MLQLIFPGNIRVKSIFFVHIMRGVCLLLLLYEIVNYNNRNKIMSLEEYWRNTWIKFISSAKNKTFTQGESYCGPDSDNRLLLRLPKKFPLLLVIFTLQSPTRTHETLLVCRATFRNKLHAGRLYIFLGNHQNLRLPRWSLRQVMLGTSSDCCQTSSPKQTVPHQEMEFLELLLILILMDRSISQTWSTNLLERCGLDSWNRISLNWKVNESFIKSSCWEDKLLFDMSRDVILLPITLK